jgi:hypothetical protein
MKTNWQFLPTSEAVTLYFPEAFSNACRKMLRLRDMASAAGTGKLRKIEKFQERQHRRVAEPRKIGLWDKEPLERSHWPS